MNANPGFELHGLQRLFATSLTTVKEPAFCLDEALLRELVIAEVARVKHRLIENALNIQGEDAVRRYVRIHQYSIVAIMDKLFRRPEQPGSLKCCRILDGLLSFLQERFPDYFDEVGKAPEQRVHDMRVDIAFSFDLLQEKLLNVSAFESFTYMILDPVDRFCDNGDGQRVTFHRLRWLGYILRHAEKASQDKTHNDCYDRNLLDLLLYLNYNSRKSYMQMIEFFQILLPRDLDFVARRDTLSGYLKIATQAAVKRNTGYHPQGPSLKSQLIDYLNAELSDLDAEEHRNQQPMSELPILTKTKLDLSVAQLGCVLRLLTETGVVSTENLTALIQCLAQNCETKKSQSISAESLRVKFYDIEEGTRRAISEKLEQLLRSLNKLSDRSSA